MKIPLLHLLQVALAILSLSRSAQGQQQNPNSIRFDPDANDTTATCAIAPYTDTDNYFQPQEDQCTSTSNPLDLNSLDKASLDSIAVQYAPVIFFHPLEKYTLSSVVDTFNQTTAGKIYDRNGGNDLIDDTLNLTTLLRTSRDPIWALGSTKFYFSLEELAEEMYNSTPDARYGDGYDETTGKSKATIYYNAFESGNGTWTFNYYLWYPYNGEGNMGVVGIKVILLFMILLCFIVSFLISSSKLTIIYNYICPLGRQSRVHTVSSQALRSS